MRHLKRRRKQAARAHARFQREESRQVRRELKEHIRQVKEEDRIKLQAEKDRLSSLREETRRRAREEARLTAGILKVETAEEKKKKALEKAYLKRKKRRLFRYTVRLRMRAFFRALRSFRPGDIRRWAGEIRKKGPDFHRLVVILVNSTTLFLLSYFAVYLLAQAATVMAARMFDYPVVLYYWEVYFNIGVESWFHDSVKTIFSAGPLISLFTGLCFIIIYTNVKERNGVFKLFFLWGFLHGISMFFGAMLVGTLFGSGFGHVIDWLYIMDTGKLLYSIVSIFMLVVAGFIAVRPFLLSANSYYRNLKRGRRRTFMWAQIIVPFITGNILLTALRQPRFMFYETFVTFTIAISLIPVLSIYPAYRNLYFEEDSPRAEIDWRSILILAAVIVFYRGILNFGISLSG